MAQIVTLGCRMNIAESARMATLLAGDEALTVVNSCAVTAEAARATRTAIRRARRAHPNARLVVTGCGAEIDRARLAAMAEVDGIVPNAAKLDPRAWNVAANAAQLSRLPGHTRAFVDVQNGCDHACSFCIIPMGRGRSRSHATAGVVAEIAALVDAGVKEVVLTGVDLAAWGADLAIPSRLGALVAAILLGVPSLPRLRISSLDVAAIDPELEDLFAGEARLMPHLHLSLQHGADLILKRMKRRHSRGEVQALVERLKARRPALAIGADLIAGFPTETETHHAASLAMIAELGIVHAHIFPFSARASTPAARMPQLPARVITARAAALRACTAVTREGWLTTLLHTELAVLAERDGTGHSEEFARVRLPADTPVGTLCRVTPFRIVDGVLA